MRILVGSNFGGGPRRIELLHEIGDGVGGRLLKIRLVHSTNQNSEFDLPFPVDGAFLAVWPVCSRT